VISEAFRPARLPRNPPFRKSLPSSSPVAFAPSRGSCLISSCVTTFDFCLLFSSRASLLLPRTTRSPRQQRLCFLPSDFPSSALALTIVDPFPFACEQHRPAHAPAQSKALFALKLVLGAGFMKAPRPSPPPRPRIVRSWYFNLLTGHLAPSPFLMYLLFFW